MTEKGKLGDSAIGILRPLLPVDFGGKLNPEFSHPYLSNIWYAFIRLCDTPGGIVTILLLPDNICLNTSAIPALFGTIYFIVPFAASLVDSDENILLAKRRLFEAAKNIGGSLSFCDNEDGVVDRKKSRNTELHF
jgi:hypothetical protein